MQMLDIICLLKHKYNEHRPNDAYIALSTRGSYYGGSPHVLLMLLLTFHKHTNNSFTVLKNLTASAQGIDTEYYYTMVIDNTNLLDCFVTLPTDGRKSQLYWLTKRVRETLLGDAQQESLYVSGGDAQL